MFKSFLMAVSIAALSWTSSYGQSAAADRLCVDQVASDIDLAREAYRRIHPGYLRYADKAKLETAWSDIVTKAKQEGGMSKGDFYLSVQKVLTLIRCDHTKAELPKALRNERNKTPVYLPCRWQYVDGRGFVTLVSAKSQLQVGDEILAIDGKPLAQRVSEVEVYVPYDGETIWSREGEIGESLEFMGGAVDHFGALLWEVRPQAKLKIRRSGKDQLLSIDRVKFDAWKAIGDAKPGARNFKDAVTYKRIGDETGYLRIDTFVNYRDPVKPIKLLEPIFKSIRDEKRKFLILDLRENGGGSNDAYLCLMAHLITAPLKAKKDMRVATLDLDGLREHLWTWDKRALNPNPWGFNKNDDGTYSLKAFVDEQLQITKPAKFAFDGALVVLTSKVNSSGSTTLSAVLRANRKTILIGDRTGGSAEGPTAELLFTLTLPESGVRARVPFIRSYNNVDKFEPGLGLSPDIEAPMTADAFLAGQDPAYEAALSYIKSAVSK